MSEENNPTAQLRPKKDTPERKPIHLGIPGRPFPIYGTETIVDDEGRPMGKNGWIIRDVKSDSSKDQVAIYSERSSKEVMALLYRNLPKPTMLEIFWKGTELRMPNSRRRLEFIKGFPGGGKTFMANLHAQLRTKTKPLAVDCGGRNLQDLLWETILDFDSDPSFYKSLEERGAKGELNPASRRLLKAALGKAYQEEGNVVVFNWDRLKNQDTTQGDGVTDEQMQEIAKTLEQVRSLEFPGGDHNALGLKMVPGVIYQAFTENRPLILDEYNKSKDGSDDAMQTMLQFINGEIDEVTIHSPMKDDSSTGQSFTLKREDMGDLFFVTATGNAVVDGVSTRPLSESANQRWQPVTIPNSTLEDWTHSWTQFTSGVPISTLYEMGYQNGENQWDKDPKSFTNFLKAVLTADKTEAEIAMIPEEYFDFAENWQDILTASKDLAEFTHEWSSLLDPDNFDKPDELSEEIDEEEYSAEVAMGYRKIIMWLDRARKMIPLPRSQKKAGGVNPDTFFEEYDFVEEFRKPTSLEYGDRLANIILEEITDTTFKRGKHNLYAHLMEKAQQRRIRSRITTERSASRTKLISDSFNVSPFKGANDEANAEIIRREILAHLKKQDPNRFHNMDEDDIIPLPQLQRFIGHLKVYDRPDHTQNHSSDVLLINDAFGLDDDIPFVDFKTIDDTAVVEEEDNNVSHTAPAGSIPYNPNHQVAPQIEEPIEVETKDLVAEDALLKSLVLPVIGEFNLNSFWNSALTYSGVTTSSYEDCSIDMAENNENVPFATTTIIVRSKEGNKTPLHFVRNNQTGALLIVGNDITEEMQRRFTLAHITYVSRNDTQAQAKVDVALDRIFGGYSQKMRDSLKMAFLHRNASTDTQAKEKDEDRTFKDLLVANDIECFNQHHITRHKSGRILESKFRVKAQ